MTRLAAKNTAERVELRAPVSDVRRWHATSGLEGVTLSEWIRRVCNDAAIDQDTFDFMKTEAARKHAAATKKPKNGTKK